MNLDQDIRVACQTNVTDHITLEAGAGSGKTATLIARILHWIIKVGWERLSQDRSEEERVFSLMHRVVAITFTEAAAEEMVDRLGIALITLSRYDKGEPVVGFSVAETELEPSEIRRRSRLLLGVVDQMRISTIHSFCRSILKSYPLEADLHPQFDIDADGNKAKLIVHDELVRVFRDQLQNHSDSAMRTIFEAGISMELFRDHLLRAVQWDSFPFPNPITIENLTPTYGEIERLINLLEPFFGKVPTTKRSTHQHEIIALIELCGFLQSGMQSVRSVRGKIDHEEELVGWVQSNGKAITRIKRWSKLKDVSKKLSVEEREEVVSLCVKLTPYLEQLKYYRPSLIVHTVDLLNYMVPKVQQTLKKNGVVSFSDLLHKTAVLLKKDNTIVEKLRSGIDLLLVDEFQDTSLDQCAIIEILGLHPDCEYPKLFIVGDPKQSIYGWLNADISSYFSFAEKVANFRGESGVKGQSWRLTANFRSLPSILNAVEETFSGYMNNVEGLQASFKALDCMRTEDVAPFPALEIWTAWPKSVCSTIEPSVTEKEAISMVKKISASQALEEEAESLARDLLRMNQEEKMSWKDCALLFRSTTNLDSFLQALKKRQIPYAVTRDKNYFRRREIIEAHTLLSCIFLPLDQISLIGALRSSMVGLPDAALFLLWKHGFPELFGYLDRIDDATYYTAEKRLLTMCPQIDRLAVGITGYKNLKNWPETLCHFLRAIRQLRIDQKVLPSDVFLKRLRDYIGFSFSEVRAYQGAYRLANLDRFFYSVQMALEESKGDWHLVLETLSQAIQEGQDGEEARPADPNQDAVQIMTIHKSKGLDFQHVYILELHRGSGGRSGGDMYSGFCKVLGTHEFAALGLRTLGYGAEVQRKKNVEIFERLRLLYVAMTRAKDRLVLSGCFPALISEGNQESTTLMSQHLQGLFVKNKISNLWNRPSSSQIILRYLGDYSTKGGVAPSSVRASPSASVLQKHQEYLDMIVIPKKEKYSLSSISTECTSIPEYAELEKIFVPLLQNPKNIHKSKQFVIRRLSGMQTTLFSIRDVLDTLFRNISSINNDCMLWHNRNISIGKLRYQIHRLEQREDALCLVEYVFLEYVQGISIVDSWEEKEMKDTGLLRACAHLQSFFQRPVHAELWGIQSKNKWSVSAEGLIQIDR
jgi:ATP-dependent helicase/nuclease subunit A